MIALSNTQEQALAVGQSLIFDRVVVKSGCGECHRANTASVKLTHPGTYIVSFTGNIASETAATEVQIQLELGGDPIPESLMISTSVAGGELNNVATMVPIKNCCCDYDRITVTNVGAGPVTIGANSCLMVYPV